MGNARLWGLGIVLGTLAVACGDSSDGGANGTGGSSSGGSSSGGSSSGGASFGGASTGGASSGGANTGGTSTGGASTGGTSTGGTSTGGASSGGASTGGASTGGANTGGANTGGADAGVTVCGGKQGKPCANDEYCNFQPDSCGLADQTGACTKRPQICTADCPGVCGCDGKLYCNTCNAAAAGTDVTGDKSCVDAGTKTDAGVGTACNNDNECNLGLKCCYPCGIPGCQNQCIVPINGKCPLFP